MPRNVKKLYLLNGNWSLPFIKKLALSTYMTGEPRDPHSVSAFMTTGMWGVRVSRWGILQGGQSWPQRCTGTCLRPRRTTSPRWQSVESALDHVRLGSRTKTALNSSTEMQEMLLCPSGMFPGERDAFPLPNTAFQGSVIRSLRLILGSHFPMFFFNSVLLRLFPPNTAALDTRHTGHASVC